MGKLSAKAARFSESVIRELSRVGTLEGGVNLAQGFPDFPAPQPMKAAACRAIQADVNQYAVTWGAPRLRRAIAERLAAYNGISVDPEREVTVCCGATEGMIASLLAVLDPGDEVVVFEPFYENYGPDCILSGATPGTAADALGFGQDYFAGLAREYLERRDFVVALLRELGFGVFLPRGAYYVMTDIAPLTREDDVSFAMHLVRQGGVATVPGSSFFLDPADGRSLVRFCFAKRRETLERAASLLRERLGGDA